ncbi:MAG: cobalamin-dependent protein [Candidatus Adiutrix sp.]|jgi:methylmalonyl-CoA mutase C-terminal domain/subunit|nr:cobalamin-dependent protein [Candidatus Adiutrix sp.]
MTKKIRVLIGKCGCDIHERGALTMLNVLRDNGMEVIYTGRFQSEAGMVNAAINEDVDVITLSDLTGSLVIICRKVLEELKKRGAEDIPVICGGLLTKDDIAELEKMGVKGCFATGSPPQGTVDLIRQLAPSN